MGFTDDVEKEYVEVTGMVKAVSQKAVLIDFGDCQKWVPKSQMEDWPDIGETGDVLIAEWWAEQEELI